MIKNSLIAFSVTVFIAVTAAIVGAAPFTIQINDLDEFYEVGQVPGLVNTAIANRYITSDDTGVFFGGSVYSYYPHDDFAYIQIGVNDDGVNDGTFNAGIMGTGGGANVQTISELGLNDVTGYDSYALKFENFDDKSVWDFSLFFIAPMKDNPYTEVYVQSAWTQIDPNATKILTLDFSNCLEGFGTANAFDYLDMKNLQAIGFNIGGYVPIDPERQYDFCFETKVSPIPEPASILLMGFGLLGFGSFARKKYGRKENN